MNPLLIGPILDIGKSLLDRFGPEDKGERAKADAEFMRMAAEGELKQAIAQLEINAKEAAHPSVWVSGWRPFFGWAGGAGFIYATILQPMLAWWASIKGWPVPPILNLDLLWIVVTGMLGIGGLRSVEKIKGVSR
jgi:hypothetical protein